MHRLRTCSAWWRTTRTLSLGARQFAYDAVGDVQINRLSDIVNTAIAQDPARLGANIEELTQRFLYQPLGMTDSTWSDGAAEQDLRLHVGHDAP